MDTNILTYGAESGGQILCTHAIQSAIDACAASGGGRVTIPSGTYRSGTIWLRSNVELHLAHGAVLKASADLADYNPIDAYPQNYGYANEKWVGKHLIVALECTHTALTGTGIIDGSGEAFLAQTPREAVGYVWRDGFRSAADAEKKRPGQLICFVECTDVTVRDVTLTNMPCWGLFLHGCESVSIRGIRVLNSPSAANSDGIDIDTCRFVTVSDCIIDTGDDAIAIRADAKRLNYRRTACEYITISNCVLSSSASLFRLGVGNGRIAHVQVCNITADRGGVALNLMTDYAGSGHVSISDVRFSGILAANLGFPICIHEGSGAEVRRVEIENFSAECMACVRIASVHPGQMSGITLRNCAFSLIESPFELTPELRTRRGRTPIECYNVSELTLDHVRFHVPEAMQSDWDSRNCFVQCTGMCNGTEISPQSAADGCEIPPAWI